MKEAMESIKRKIEEFLKSHPDCRNFLQDIVKKVEKEVDKEIDDYEMKMCLKKRKSYINMILRISKNLFFLALNTKLS